jgi:hypothetical protein
MAFPTTEIDLTSLLDNMVTQGASEAEKKSVIDEFFSRRGTKLGTSLDTDFNAPIANKSTTPIRDVAGPVISPLSDFGKTVFDLGTLGPVRREASQRFDGVSESFGLDKNRGKGLGTGSFSAGDLLKRIGLAVTDEIDKQGSALDFISPEGGIFGEEPSETSAASRIRQRQESGEISDARALAENLMQVVNSAVQPVRAGVSEIAQIAGVSKAVEGLVGFGIQGAGELGKLDATLLTLPIQLIRAVETGEIRGVNNEDVMSVVNKIAAIPAVERTARDFTRYFEDMPEDDKETLSIMGTFLGSALFEASAFSAGMGIGGLKNAVARRGIKRQLIEAGFPEGQIDDFMSRPFIDTSNVQDIIKTQTPATPIAGPNLAPTAPASPLVQTAVRETLDEDIVDDVVSVQDDLAANVNTTPPSDLTDEGLSAAMRDADDALPTPQEQLDELKARLAAPADKLDDLPFREEQARLVAENSLSERDYALIKEGLDDPDDALAFREMYVQAKDNEIAAKPILLENKVGELWIDQMQFQKAELTKQGQAMEKAAQSVKKVNTKSTYDDFVDEIVTKYRVTIDSKTNEIIFTNSGLDAPSPTESQKLLQFTLNKLKPGKKSLSGSDVNSLRHSIRIQAEGIKKTGFLPGPVETTLGHVQSNLLDDMGTAGGQAYVDAATNYAILTKSLRGSGQIIGFKGRIEDLPVKNLKAGAVANRFMNSDPSRVTEVVDEMTSVSIQFGYEGSTNIEGQARFVELMKDSFFDPQSRAFRNQIMKANTDALQKEAKRDLAKGTFKILSFRPARGLADIMNAAEALGQTSERVARQQAIGIMLGLI